MTRLNLSNDTSAIYFDELFFSSFNDFLCLREEPRAGHGFEQRVQHQHQLVIVHCTLNVTLVR